MYASGLSQAAFQMCASEALEPIPTTLRQLDRKPTIHRHRLALSPISGLRLWSHDQIIPLKNDH